MKNLKNWAIATIVIVIAIAFGFMINKIYQNQKNQENAPKIILQD